MILRLATFADEKLLLDWRNDPTVLAALKDPTPLSEERHHRWLATVLSGSDDSSLYIAEVDSVPVGQGRIERAWKIMRKKMDTCMIGYSIGQEYRGTEYGTLLATELVKLAKAQGYSEIGCRIKRTNLRSVVVALRAGVNSIDIF